MGADLLGALGAVPGEDPVLLVLDDLQWADPASVRVLVFALRRLRHDRVLVLAGVRVAGTGPGAQEPAPADAWWERLPAAGRAIRRVRLEGLEPAELSELAAAVGRPLGSTGAAERLWRHTRGHPLHARALLEELPPEVLAGSADALPAPRSLSSVVLVRLARAAPATEALVVATSVLGESAPLALAAAVAGLDDPAAALDEAVGMGLVEELPGGPTVRIGFVHPLVRAAIRGDLPPMRRRALHAASAGLLSGRAALDHRVAAAAGPDPELAAEIEDLVAEPGAALAGSEAADLLRAAADLSTDPDDRERRLLAAASRLLADGEVARAVALEGAVEGCRPGPWRTAVLGQLALVTGRFGVARERLEAALATGAPGDGRPGDRARAGAAAHLAVLHLLRGDPARAIETAGVALAHPARGDDVRLPAGLALILGLAVAGRGDDARAILDRAGGDDGRGPPVDALTLRGMLATLGGDDATAVAAPRRGGPPRAGGRAGARAGPRPRLPPGGRGPDRGRPTAWSRASSWRSRSPATGGRRCPARSRTRSRPRRWRSGDAGTRRAPTSRRRRRPARAGGASTCARRSRGRCSRRSRTIPDGVLRALAPAQEPGSARRPTASGCSPRGCSRPRRCWPWAGSTRPRRRSTTSPRARPAGTPSTSRGCGSGSARPGARWPRPGVADVVAPHAVARLETEIGRRLLAAGERRAGVDLLRGARDTLARLGAAPWCARAEELLHAAGLTPAPTGGDPGALGLTPHEEAVVALVARGQTNREVGRDLYITPRTVAYHLSNVYAKLGVTSRRELGARTTGSPTGRSGRGVRPRLAARSTVTSGEEVAMHLTRRSPPHPRRAPGGHRDHRDRPRAGVLRHARPAAGPGGPAGRAP